MYGESRMHGVEQGKSWRCHQRLTYCYSFFTDPTISTLTSGTPSQNADLPGMSFPRCLGVRFHAAFLEKYHLIGMQAKWMSYDDKDFTKELGKDFYHEDLISREGWAKYYFKGKYPRDIAYVKLQILNPQTGMLIRTFYYQFKKSYQTSLDARYYVTDPVLGDKIVKNGVLVELRRFKRKDGSIVYRKAKTTFNQTRIVDVMSPAPKKEQVGTHAIIRTMVRYSEKPKMLFLITPPHLMKYAKLILILIKQLVDLNFDKSYMTKSNQKPLYKTRFMLDELGNLQSDGHGISGLATMLSIGLGQEQQFTLILQTLQQLRDVYGDSVDKIVQGNTSNIVFLKSTDDSMLDTLQKMSGVTHKTFTDSKTVTQDKERIWMQNEGKVSYTSTTREMPVITYNDFAFIAERNSIVLRAGDSPIWNRNETILPMSWRLFKDTIEHAGHEYTLQTIPTLSSALDFDVRKNQPNFEQMVNKRQAQACMAGTAKEMYQKAYGYSDYQISQLDPDNYSDDVMCLINDMIRISKKEDGQRSPAMQQADADMDVMAPENLEENEEVLAAINQAAQEQAVQSKPQYAGNMICKDDLVAKIGGVSHAYDSDIIKAYIEVRSDMYTDKRYFMAKPSDRGLYSSTGVPYILEASQSASLQSLNDAAKSDKSKVYADGPVKPSELKEINSFEVTDEFYKFLVSLDTWNFAKGRFEREMARLVSTR